MTFQSILADSYRRLGLPSSPAADTVTRIKQFVQETYEELLSKPGMGSLLYGSLTVASVASRARYGLSNVAQIRAMTEATNDAKLAVRSLAWYRATDPDPASNEGIPEVLIPLGHVAVAQVPATTGTGLWIVSSSASDTTPTVTIDAIRVGGYPHSPTAATTNGTTRVQIGGGSGLTDYIDVTQFQLSAACVGDISLYDAAAAGNLLAVIPRGQTTSRYFGFYLYPTPSSATTYTVDVEHEIQALSADTDEPRLPQRFHRLLAIGARRKEYEKTKDPRHGVAVKEYEQGVNELVYAVTCPPDFIGIPGGGDSDGGSNLGSQFPAGRW